MAGPAGGFNRFGLDCGCTSALIYLEVEGTRRPRHRSPAAALPVLLHAGRTELRSAHQAFEQAGQVLPAGRAVHPAPLVYLRVHRRFDRLGRPAVGRDYDTTSLPSRNAPGTPFPASRRAGYPTEPHLLRSLGVAGAALDTAAFAQGSGRQPPSLFDQAKAMGRRRRRPGKWPNSGRPVKGAWPGPVAQCFAERWGEVA